MNSVSIIIPIYNEGENILKLLDRLRKVILSEKRVYEVIFIDDHSNDNSRQVITSAKTENKFQINYFLKKGKKGKAYSLLEGFKYAKNSVIVMIDGDLQYPPEAIPQMVSKIEKGADIVVSNRKSSNTNFLRSISSSVFTFLFIKLLHGFALDSQSGLKAFRKSILKSIDIKPNSAWMFDLEFLLQARNAGYVIKENSISFSKREYGNSKINIVKASIEMAFEAMRLRYKNNGLIPFTNAMKLKKGIGFHYYGKEYISHSNLSLNESAFKRFTFSQKVMLLLLALLLLSFSLLKFHFFIIIILSLITSFYFLDLLFQMYLTLITVKNDPSISVSNDQLNNLNNSELPIYTVLCPLYKEWAVLPQFITAIDALVYPKNKLQVLILLEEDDKQSIKKISKMNLPKHFEMIIVPHSFPKTKPKALNYGLKFTKGEYIVIYDAEDKPEPLQLKKALIAFSEGDNSVACVQAKLNYYNTSQNILTRLFSIEYSLWFELILPGLQALNTPIPLGGTSNHFKTKLIRKLQGWDSFNVTEDADLGIRLFKKGYRTEIIDSTTYEEATSGISNWIKQRSRWIKGYMQTYFVHLRRSNQEKNTVNPNLIAYHLLIGSKSFFLLINPILWLMTILYFCLRPFIGGEIESFYLPLVLYIGSFTLLIGNFLYFFLYLIALSKKSEWDMVFYAMLVPFYWVLLSYAAIQALIEFIVKPHHWNKTNHGFHLQQNTIIQKVQIPLSNQKLFPNFAID